MKKTILTMLLMATTAIAALADDEISVWDGSSYSSSLDVQGKNIYIRSANDFAALRKLWKTYKGVSGSDGSGYDTFFIYLECDIDLDNHNFIDWCIGWEEDNEFGGYFYGQGHVIKNLYIYGESANRALFGYLNGGNVYNLKIDGFNVESGRGGESHVGVLCGRMVNHSTISHCAVVNGTLKGWNDYTNDDELGLICGYTDGNHNEILYCCANGTVYGGTQIGGIVGKVNNTDDDKTVIKHCYFSGTIAGHGSKYYGAIVGERWSNEMRNNYYLNRNDGVKSFGNSSGIRDCATNSEIKPCTDAELKAPLLFGFSDAWEEYIYLFDDYPELKVFLRYKPGDMFYVSTIGYKGTGNDYHVRGYLKVLENKGDYYTVELIKAMDPWPYIEQKDITVLGDFSPYFSEVKLRMVSLSANSFQEMGSLNTLTLPATLTSIGVPQRHSVQNAFIVNGEGSGCAVKDGALYDLTNSRLIKAPKSFSALTIHQQYANSIVDYAFENMSNMRKLYVDTYVPAGTPVDDGANKAPLITLDGENIFNGTPSDLDIYIKDGTANQIFLGKQGPNLYGYSNADKWKNFYYEYEDKPNHMFSYFPVSRNSGGMSTLMLGYPVELPEGVTAWWASSLSDGIVHMRPIGTQVVPALTPVLLTYEGSSYRLDLSRYEGSDAGVATDYEGNVFKGSIDPGGHKMTSSEMMSNFFTLGRPYGDTSYDNLGFYRYNPTNNVLPSYVAWIARADIPTDVRLAMDFNEETTAIRGIADQTAAADREPVVYTLQGVRISRADMRQGGIYVVNGKKVVIR